MNLTTTTFPSDDEWELIERAIRRRIWLATMTRRIALMAAATLILFAFLYWLFCVHHLGEGRYDQWGEALRHVQHDTTL